MSEVIPPGKCEPLRLFHDEPHFIIYDSGAIIHDPTTQLDPFGAIVHVYHDIKVFINEIHNYQHQKLSILLIFPNRNETGVQRFLMKYQFIQEYSFALYLIFPNGLAFHEKWINTPTMNKLRWCRSFTLRLFPDIYDICKSVCDQRITFYDQRQIQAADDIENNKLNSAGSIATLFARKKIEFSLLLSHYLTMSLASDD